ncbi:MAG: ABC transporter ATP-binding protein/permease [Candidatus Promineofilum sp.]|uniref:ABC transporter ATP-binding protein n=1 Tax=Promineifilum sp. TaxID=2664178 RepID=UPI002411C375|nr:ABC transporter ATP-binding protein/permease [Promineifilum sp.]
MEDYFEEEDFTTRFSGQTVTRILQQVVPYWKMVAGFLGLVILITVADSIFTYFGKQLVDEAILPGDPDALRRILTNYALLSIVSAAIVFGFIFITGILGEKVRYDLRRKLFTHLQQLSFSYFDKTPIGWIMSRVTSDTERIADLVTWGLLDVTWGITSLLVASIFMLTINWRMAILVMLTIPVLVAVAVYFRRLILVQFREVRRINSRITGAYNENIQGVRVTKSLVREEQDLRDFQGLTGLMFQASYRANVLSALFLPAVQLISAIGVSLVIWYGGVLALRGETTVGQIQAFIGYVTFMIWPVQEMARVFAQMQQSIASGERVFSLLDAVPDVRDKPGALETARLEGDIVFDNVTFYYEKGKPVLTDFNLRVRPGETIALVGPTGGGKSTIVNLLCRFYEPKEGRILFGEHDYTDLTQHAIQSRIGMVLQTPHLFSGTIRDNLRYGRLDASDDELVDAARLAGAHDFIVTLENGYDEQVGEGGSKLSVGQKQLISLARAILADPDLFIMDEATSSVDTLTEALIQRGMEQMMEGRTSFVIAHRLSTIRRASRILVIEDGRIAEYGTHAELIRAGGHYYNLYTRQFRREREVALGL